MICDLCHKDREVKIDESGQYCQECYEAWAKKSALDAGIPLSVIEGETKLTDHFSQDYIDQQCGRTLVRCKDCGNLYASDSDCELCRVTSNYKYPSELVDNSGCSKCHCLVCECKG